MQKFRKYILLAIILLIVVVGVFYWKRPLVPKLSINNHIFTYDLAITPEQLSQGLSGRDPLTDSHGMLFVFDHKEKFTFWMKDMKFPLDFIWIDDRKVVDITLNVPTPVEGQQLPVYSPKLPVNRVFEVTAGTVARYGIKEGDTVTYLK